MNLVTLIHFSAHARDSSEKARQVEEYLQRKKEAAMNRHRGHADMAGLGVAGALGARPARPSSAQPAGMATCNNKR